MGCEQRLVVMRALFPVRTDDLGVVPIRALMQRYPNVNWEKLDDVFYGCANQAG